MPNVNIVPARAHDFAASALILLALVVPTLVMAVVVIDEHLDTALSCIWQDLNAG